MTSPQQTPLEMIAAARIPTSAELAASNGLTVVVFGTPKPKGSLKHVGRGRMVEDVEGSAEWREVVALAARSAFRSSRLEAAFDGPVVVELTVTVPRTDAAAKRGDLWPDRQGDGDIDKHARNVCDALADAGVVTNDARVVELRALKVFPITPVPEALPEPGALIYLYPNDIQREAQ